MMDNLLQEIDGKFIIENLWENLLQELMRKKYIELMGKFIDNC